MDVSMSKPSLNPSQVKANSMPPGSQEFLDQATVMDSGVVTDHVDVAIRTQSPPEVVQMGDEQLGVASCAGGAQ